MKASCLPIRLRDGLKHICTYSPRPVTLHCQQSARNFMNTSTLRAGIAAREIDFDDTTRDGPRFNARLVPGSPAYFTAQPNFTDDLLILQSLVERFSTLPLVKPGEAPRVAWRSLMEYRDVVGETVKASKYHKIVQILHRLNQIHPSLVPEEVAAALQQYKRDINPYQNVPKIAPIDGAGRTLGAGRRKASTAQAWLVEGTGEVLVNGKTLVEAFGRIHDRESVIWALKATDRFDKYNVWAKVNGGGTTGQAEALTLAVGKALIAHEPALKPALRRAGCVTRDPRRVERKKPGHVKARKMPAWVKR